MELPWRWNAVQVLWGWMWFVSLRITGNYHICFLFHFVKVSLKIRENKWAKCHMKYIAHMYNIPCIFLTFPFPMVPADGLSFSVLPFPYLSLSSPRCLSLLFDLDTAWDNMVASETAKSKTFCALHVCVCFNGKPEHFLTTAYGERMDFKRTAPFLLAKQKMRVSWQHRNSCPQYVCVDALWEQEIPGGGRISALFRVCVHACVCVWRL